MYIIEDTRQKDGKHNTKHAWFETNDISLVRNMLPFGDYALPPKVSIDTKENMLEIVSNLVNEHIRFKNECIRAQECGCQLIILVENEDGIRSVTDVYQWKNPRRYVSAKAPTGERIAKSMETMHERYGVIFEFCTPQESGKRIIELLEIYDG